MSTVIGTALPSLALAQGLGQITTLQSNTIPVTTIPFDGYSMQAANGRESFVAHQKIDLHSNLSIHSQQPSLIVSQEYTYEAETQPVQLLQESMAQFVASSDKKNEVQIPKHLFNSMFSFLTSILDAESGEGVYSIRDIEKLRFELVKAKNNSLVPEKKEPAMKMTPAEALKPLESVFLNRETMKTLLRVLGVKDLARGEKVKRSGAILKGPPGTGKTISMRAIAKVYENFGGYSLEISEAKATGKYAGSKARNLDNALTLALEEANKRGVPSFIFMDEASSTVSKSDGSSLSSYYQEALDTLKRFIGNYPGKFVFAISTNEDAEKFEEALIREGRLQIVHMGFPEVSEKVKMWKHFMKEFDLNQYFGEVTDEEFEKLALALPQNSQGAAIVEFCQEYLDRLIESEEEKLNDHDDPVKALQEGHTLTLDDVKDKITIDNFITELKGYYQNRHSHKDEKSSQEPQKLQFARKRVTGFDTEARKKSA